MKDKFVLIKTPTGFYLWKNPEEKDQELLGCNVPYFGCNVPYFDRNVPYFDRNGVDLRKYNLSTKNCESIEQSDPEFNQWSVEIETTFIEEEKTGLHGLSWGRLGVKLDADGCLILKIKS